MKISFIQKSWVNTPMTNSASHCGSQPGKAALHALWQVSLTRFIDHNSQWFAETEII